MEHLAFFLQQPPMSQEQAMQFALGFMSIALIFMLVMLIVITIPAWFICKKAGFSPWLSLLCLIPSIGYLVLLYVLAFAEWPSQKAPVPLGFAPPPAPPQPPVLQG